MKIFDQLRQSGIPLDWTTILMGWWDLRAYGTLLTIEQLQAFAMDQIGHSSPEQFDLTAQLAFADPTDTWTIKRSLEQLASNAPATLIRAKHVWRWAVLNELVTDFVRMAHEKMADGSPINGVWLDDFNSALWKALIKIWGEFDFPSDDFPSMEDWENGVWATDLSEVLEFLEDHRQWLTGEKANL